MIKTHAVWVETNVDTSARRLHTTILEMDTTLGGNRYGVWHTEMSFNRFIQNNLQFCTLQHSHALLHLVPWLAWCILHLRHYVPQYINYLLKSEVAIMLPSQLCYTAVWINSYLKRTSAIKVATTKITDDFHHERKPSCTYHKIDTFCGEQRWMKYKGARGHWQVHKECIAYTAVWQKSPLGLKQCQAAKNQACSLAIIELH